MRFFFNSSYYFTVNYHRISWVNYPIYYICSLIIKFANYLDFMKHFYPFIILIVISTFGFGQTTIAIQDFDGSVPDWSYSNDTPFFDNGWSADGYYGLIDISSAVPINQSNMSANILGENDLNDEGNGTSGFATTSFSTVDIRTYRDVVLSFDWDIVGYNANNDDARYEVFYDGVGQGVVFLLDGNGSTETDEGTVSIDIPDTVQTVSLEIEIRNDGLVGFSGFDNFSLIGFLRSTTYEANNSNGFGGPLGEGDFQINAFTSPTADFTFTRGSGAFNDHMVIYIDSETGGVTSTSGLTDTGDAGRRAVSGYDGFNRSIVNFPPGFEADFAIAIDQNFAGLFDIVEGGAHNFVASANLSPTGTTTSGSYTFSINFTDINTTAGANSFKFVTSYLNSSNAFRSNEFIGRTIYDNNASGNSGYTTVDMQSYYEVYSHDQGGEAPSQADGLWSDDASWVNGNPPLEGDQVTINNAIQLDLSYSNSQTMNINGSLNIPSGFSLITVSGIDGSGSLILDGNLSLNEGGFTTITPTYGAGSTLEYKNISSAYNRFNEWGTGASVGVGVPDNVIIDNADLDLSNPSGDTSDQDFTIGSNLTLLNGANLNIDPTKSLTVGGNFNNTASTVILNSNSQNYAALKVDGTATGTAAYHRHVNILAPGGSSTGSNDLISPPVTNTSQTFGTFRAINSNIPSGTIGGSPAFLFGPFDNSVPEYINYSTTNNSDILTAGIGYRTASTDNSTFTFEGDVETTTVNVPIDMNTSQWNLRGNPFTTYLNAGDFLTENATELDENAVGIYGYDGSASDGWTIINFNNANTATNLAPGQGFFVASDVVSGTLSFTPAMQRVSGGDDFILGRSSNEDNHYLKLEMTGNDKLFKTEFYFNSNSSLGLDPGYDAINFDNESPNFSMYSHLVEDNEGKVIAIQSLNTTDLVDVVIPLGVHASQGQQFVISIAESSLPDTVDVYLDDTLENTSFLLNEGDYILSPSSNLSGTGRFFLRFSKDALSTSENGFDTLNIYTNNQTKEIVIEGQLDQESVASLYDLHGRLITNKGLQIGNISQSISTTELSSGVYIVVVDNDYFKITKKVILR